MLIMIERACSLLLILGLLLPPTPLCLGLDLSGGCETGSSCCCAEPELAPQPGPTFSSAMSRSGGCPCELSAPQTTDPSARVASGSEVSVPLLALDLQEPGPVASVDWSSAQSIDAVPRADVRTRPLRVTAGVRLI